MPLRVISSLWSCSTSMKFGVRREKEENAAYETKTAAGRKNDKKKVDVEVEGRGLVLFDDEE